MKSSVRIVALAGMLAVAACGDDGVSPGNLSEEEAQELATAIFSQSLFDALALNYQQPAQAPGGPQLATYTATVETTGQCPLGGTVAMEAVVDVETDDQTGAGSVDFSVDLTHVACVLQGDRGTQFTLTGDPNIGFDFLMTTDGQESAEFSGSVSGAIMWSREDGGGTCSVGYEFSGSSSSNGFSFETAGSVCGTTFSESFSVSG